MEKKSHCPEILDEIEHHFEAKNIHFEAKWHTTDRAHFLDEIKDSDKVLVAVGPSRKQWHHAFCLERAISLTASPTGWLAIYQWGKEINPTEKTFNMNEFLSEKTENPFFKSKDDQLWFKGRDGWYVFTEAEVLHEDGHNEIQRTRAGPFKTETEAKAEAEALKTKSPHIKIDGVAQQHQLTGDDKSKYWYIVGDIEHAPAPNSKSHEPEILHEKLGPFLTKENAEHSLKVQWSKVLKNPQVVGTNDEPSLKKQDSTEGEHKHVQADDQGWFIVPNKDETRRVGPYKYRKDAFTDLHEKYGKLENPSIMKLFL